MGVIPTPCWSEVAKSARIPCFSGRINACVKTSIWYKWKSWLLLVSMMSVLAVIQNIDVIYNNHQMNLKSPF